MNLKSTAEQRSWLADWATWHGGEFSNTCDAILAVLHDHETLRRILSALEKHIEMLCGLDKDDLDPHDEVEDLIAILTPKETTK